MATFEQRFPYLGREPLLGDNPLDVPDGPPEGRGSEISTAINPLRVSIHSAGDLEAEDLAGAMVVIVDTRVAPVLSAALGNGSPGASVFATAADIAVALAQDGSVGTDDLIGVGAPAGGHHEFAMGGVEPREELASVEQLEAQKAEAETALEAARLQLINAKHNNSGDPEALSEAEAAVQRGETRLAALNARLGANATPASQLTGGRGFDPTGADRLGAIQAVRRRREVDAAMERFWRDRSFRSFERDVVDKPVLFGAGELFETIAAAAAAKQVLMASALNLYAVRQAVLRWWAEAAAPVITSSKGWQSPHSRVLLVSSASATDGGTAESPALCDLLAALLAYQLLQIGEVELDEEDFFTRSLVSEVVRAGSDGRRGWRDYEALLKAALQREREAAGERLHPAEAAAILHFGRHAAVPVLRGGEGPSASAHMFELLPERTPKL